MTALFITFLIGGVLMIATAIPLMQRRIKPNSWYGFRTRKTLENEQVWYEVNAHAGKRLLVAGILITLASILFALIPGITLDAYALSVLAVVMLTLGIGLAQSFAFLNRIAK